MPGGLGLEPTGFSHILSARGLDVLDDALGAARRAMAEDPSEENIELFTDLQEQFQSNGGYEAESVMARLADGLGLRQELLLEDIDSLSGGQRRRVDLMRVLFQEPELMILDEPTNHLDRSAKRWLLDELGRFPGALLVVSHDLKLLDQSITKVLHISNQRLTEWKGNYSKFEAQHEADQSQRERAAELEAREIKRLSSLADSMRASTEKRARKAKALDKRVERMQATRTQVDRRERASKFKLPVPPRSGAVPLEVAKLGVRYGGNEVLSDVTFHAGRGDHIVDDRPQRGGEVLTACAASPASRSPPTAWSSSGRTSRWATSPRSMSRSIRTAARSDNVSDAVLKAEKDRRALLGSFGLPVQGRRPVARDPLGGRTGQARAGHALGRRGEPPAARRADQQPRPCVHRRRRRHARRLARHHRCGEPRAGFVEALRPTYCLRLPEERFTHWREEYLDDVEMR